MRHAFPAGARPCRVALAATAALLLAAMPLGSAAPPADPGAVVDSVLAAYGGRERLKRVSGYRMEGTIDSVMRGAGSLVRTFSRPDRLKIELGYPNHPETRILDRVRGWRSDGRGHLVEATGFLLTSMVLQAARADLPWLLEERRSSLKLLRPMDGGAIQSLELHVGEGLTLTVYVETATGRVVRSSGVLEAPGMSTNFATDYSDFRSVDGVLFAFREANFAANQRTGDTIITSVSLDPPLADRDFSP